MTQYTNDEISKILSDCLCALYCPRKKFYPKKDYGSLIRIKNTLDENYLLAFARQALSDFKGIYVKTAEAQTDSITFTLLINHTYERTVTMPIESDIQ